MPYGTYQELGYDAATRPKSEPPGWQMYNPITHRRKSPERYDADQRRLFVLERLKDVDSGVPNVIDPGPLRRQLASPVEPYAKPAYSYFDNEKGEMVEVPGQYLGEDSPTWRALTWMGSLPSAVYNASKELANQADRAVSYMAGIEPEAAMATTTKDGRLVSVPFEQYPGAAQKAAKDFGTFAAAFPGPQGPAISLPVDKDQPEHYNRWRELDEMRKLQDNIPAHIIDPRPNDQVIQSLYPLDQTSGVETLEDAGYSPYISVPLGVTMDIMTDPLSSIGTAVKLARSGQGLKALAGLAADGAIGAAPEVVYQNPEVVKQIRDLMAGDK